jgi:hypothetical protein
MPVMPVSATLSAKALLVGPDLRPDHAEARLQRFGVDADALDAAGRCPLAAGDFRTFESRTGGRGRRHQPRGRAEHDLGIGADIDDEADEIIPLRSF